MARKRKLRLVSVDGRHYVQVPSEDALRLLSYLRRSGLHAAPPGPCDKDSETIDFVGQVDVKNIQTLLDNWA